MRVLLFIAVVTFAGCTSSARLKPISYDYLLNDGNSKVWMINQMVIEKTDIAPRKDTQKELMIFYNDGKFQYIPVQELGHKKGRIGSYFLDSEEKTLKLYFKEDTWHFKLKQITEDAIYMTPMQDSKVEFSLGIVPIKQHFFEY